MLSWRDLSLFQEAAFAVIAFFYLSLFVLLRLGHWAAIAAALLAFLLPLAVISLVRSLAVTEAAIITRDGEPVAFEHTGLGLSMPPTRRLVGPRSVTGKTAMLMAVASPQIALGFLPTEAQAADWLPIVFTLWSWAAAAFIGVGLPRLIASNGDGHAENDRDISIAAPSRR